MNAIAARAGVTATVKLTEAQVAMLSLLEARGTAQTWHLSRRLRVGSPATYRRLRRLLALGLVEDVRVKWNASYPIWHLTEAGRLALRNKEHG